MERELAVSVQRRAAGHHRPFPVRHHRHRAPRAAAPKQVLAAWTLNCTACRTARSPAEEIARAVKQARALFAYGSENITNQAFWLGFAEMFATTTGSQTTSSGWSRSPLRMCSASAQNYLRPQNQQVVGIYLPDGQAGGRMSPDAAPPPPGKPCPARRISPACSLPNGITILARANFNSPSVVFSGYLPAGSLFDRPRSWAWPISPPWP